MDDEDFPDTFDFSRFGPGQKIGTSSQGTYTSISGPVPSALPPQLVQHPTTVDTCCYSSYFNYLLGDTGPCNLIDKFKAFLCPGTGEVDEDKYIELIIKIGNVFPKSAIKLREFLAFWQKLFKTPEVYWRDMGISSAKFVLETLHIPKKTDKDGNKKSRTPFRGQTIECTSANGQQIGMQCFTTIGRGIIFPIRCDYCGIELNSFSNVPGIPPGTKPAACEHLLEVIPLLMTLGITPSDIYIQNTVVYQNIIEIITKLGCYKYACQHCNLAKAQIQRESILVEVARDPGTGQYIFIPNNPSIGAFGIEYFTYQGHLFDNDDARDEQIDYILNLLIPPTAIDVIAINIDGLTFNLPADKVPLKELLKQNYYDEERYKSLPASSQTAMKTAIENLSKHTFTASDGSIVPGGATNVSWLVYPMVNVLVTNLNQLLTAAYIPDMRALLTLGTVKIFARIALTQNRFKLQPIAGGRRKYYTNKKVINKISNFFLKGGNGFVDNLQLLKGLNNAIECIINKDLTTVITKSHSTLKETVQKVISMNRTLTVWQSAHTAPINIASEQIKDFLNDPRNQYIDPDNSYIDYINEEFYSNSDCIDEDMDRIDEDMDRIDGDMDRIDEHMDRRGILNRQRQAKREKEINQARERKKKKKKEGYESKLDVRSKMKADNTGNFKLGGTLRKRKTRKNKRKTKTRKQKKHLKRKTRK